MVTVAKSVELNKKVAYVKGAPEILLGLSNVSDEQNQTYSKQLLEYQNKAMRTLGLAYIVLDENQEVFKDGKLNVEGLAFAGILQFLILYVRKFLLLLRNVWMLVFK